MSFQSDEGKTEEGFLLNWNCLTQWEEWIAAGDGTCRESMSLRPKYLGKDIKYQTKYRESNITCG